MWDFRRLAAVTLVVLAAQSAGAATTSAGFAVRITIVPPGEQCTTSTSVGPQGIVIVKVVCPSGTYVTADGVPVLTGPSAYKFRYYIDRASGEMATTAEPEAISDAHGQGVAPESQQVASVASFDEVPNSATHNLHELLISF
ncbi:MAG TPA: hypothetical protein VIE63_14780 [Ramlibacter sp.]|jgi:hypothetical protein